MTTPTTRRRVERLESFAGKDSPFSKLADADLYRAMRKMGLEISATPDARPDEQAKALEIVARVETIVGDMAAYYRKPSVAAAVASNIEAGHLPAGHRNHWLDLAEEWGM